MSVRTHYKLIGVAGAAALALGTMATSAVAASSDLSYNCLVLNATSVSLDPGAIPAKMVAGQKVTNSATAVFHLTPTQTGTAMTFGSVVSGNVVASGAKSTLPFKLTIPNQTLPGSPSSFDVNASGKATIQPTKAGTWTVKAGDIDATLLVDGNSLPQEPLPCTAPTDATANLGTIAVSKDGSKTTAKAPYKKGTVSASAKVAGSKYKLAGTGKVKFTLKKGSKTVKTATASLKSGSAKTSFKKIKAKGSYTVTASFSGDAALKGSSGKASFKVK